MRQTSTFATMSGDNTAMRPFAKLLWSLDTCLIAYGM